MTRACGSGPLRLALLLCAAVDVCGGARTSQEACAHTALSTESSAHRQALAETDPYKFGIALQTHLLQDFLDLEPIKDLLKQNGLTHAILNLNSTETEADSFDPSTLWLRFSVASELALDLDVGKPLGVAVELPKDTVAKVSLPGFCMKEKMEFCLVGATSDEDTIGFLFYGRAPDGGACPVSEMGAAKKELQHLFSVMRKTGLATNSILLAAPSSFQDKLFGDILELPYVATSAIKGLKKAIPYARQGSDIWAFGSKLAEGTMHFFLNRLMAFGVGWGVFAPHLERIAPADLAQGLVDDAYLLGLAPFLKPDGIKKLITTIQHMIAASKPAEPEGAAFVSLGNCKKTPQVTEQEGPAAL